MGIRYWKIRNSKYILTTLPDGAVREMAITYDLHTRAANHAVVGNGIPYGATHYSDHPYGPWIEVEVLKQQEKRNGNAT